MKFGKNLNKVVSVSDPEWGPYWIKYKFLKKKIKCIVTGGSKIPSLEELRYNPKVLAKLPGEVDFFRELRRELKECSQFYDAAEMLFQLRYDRIYDGYLKLKNLDHQVDHKDVNSWSRLLRACINLYRDGLLLENFAIMNYCGFSKILKKHDKLTGFETRDAFMRNVMAQQNFTHFPKLLDLIKKSEALFEELRELDSVMPLQDQERLFVEAVRELSDQAAMFQKHRIQSPVSPSDQKTEAVIVGNICSLAAIATCNSTTEPVCLDKLFEASNENSKTTCA